MTLYTYKVELIPTIHKVAPELPVVTLEDVLIVLGHLGWELVSCHHKPSTDTNLCVFKKPL